ncbi:MAG: MATE family efflux transporter [Clostridiales bacterium]|nr:MATE family efflux transporter [Clostridiales bacterium]
MFKKWFGDKAFLRRLMQITLPVSLQNFMLSAVAAADSFMLGSLDSRMMSAVSQATQVQFIQNMILFSVVSGCTILGAQYWGKGEKHTVRDIFCVILRLNTLVSVLFFVACRFFPLTLMTIFTNEPELQEIGVGYLKIAAWSYLLTGISQCYLGVMKVSEHPREAANISIFAVVLNIVLNAFLIYGLAFFPRMDVRGAALATVIARIAELILCVLLSLRRSYIRPSLKGLLRFHKYIAKDFAVCVLPVLSSSLLWGAGFTAYTAFMGHMGKPAAAANAIAAVVRDLVCCLCNGVASAAGIIVGNSLGAGRLSEGKEYGDRIMRLSFVIGGVSTLLMFALTPLLLTFVKLDAQTRSYLISMMLIMAVYMIGRCVNTVVINGIFYCGGDIIFDTISLIAAMWCLAVPLAFIGTHFGWPVPLVYAFTCLDEVGKIPWVMAHYRKYKWVKDLTR